MIGVAGRFCWKVCQCAPSSNEMNIFTRVVERGNALRKEAMHALDSIQAAGCALDPEETKRFDACLAPLRWGCEAVPPSVDWSSLAAVRKRGDEALAYELTVSADVDLLSGDVRFDGGCGDFGCASQSVSLPAMLGNSKQVDAWVTLAAGT